MTASRSSLPFFKKDPKKTMKVAPLPSVTLTAEELVEPEDKTMTRYLCLLGDTSILLKPLGSKTKFAEIAYLLFHFSLPLDQFAQNEKEAFDKTRVRYPYHALTLLTVNFPKKRVENESGTEVTYLDLCEDLRTIKYYHSTDNSHTMGVEMAFNQAKFDFPRRISEEKDMPLEAVLKSAGLKQTESSFETSMPSVKL